MKKLLAILAISMFAVTAVQAAEFSEVDADGDGAISMEEAKAAMPDLNEDAFKAADADGNGTLSEAEFATLQG